VEFVIVPCNLCGEKIYVKKTSYEKCVSRRVNDHLKVCRPAPRHVPPLPKRTRNTSWDGMNQQILVMQNHVLKSEPHELGTLAAAAWRRRRRRDP
jgi:hypothetical protein